MEARQIPLFKVHMPETVLEPLRKTLFSGYIGQGPRVDEFEALLAAFLGNKNVLTVNSGTSALQLALRLAGVWFDDEVISTPMTCTATNEPIMAMGARIVWADVDPLTGSIDPLDVERKITERTKAIMVVHWAGNPVNLKAICDIGQRYGIKIIEDAAHAFGAEYEGKKIGNHGDFVCFSFQAIKHLTTVDGGLVVCKSTADYRRGKLLRWYGIDRETERKDFRCEEDVLEYGYKFHMNDVAATIGIEQLKYVQGVLARHRENAAYYDGHLRTVLTVPEEPNSRSSYWLYTVHVPKREAFMEYMKNRGIMVSRVHARNDTHTMFKAFRRNLPGVHRFSETMCCIPVGWWVTPEEREHIARAINEFEAEAVLAEARATAALAETEVAPSC